MSTFEERYQAAKDRVPTMTIARALEIIAGDIQDASGVTRGALHEAAERLRKLETESEVLLVLLSQQEELRKDKARDAEMWEALGTFRFFVVAREENGSWGCVLRRSVSIHEPNIKGSGTTPQGAIRAAIAAMKVGGAR